MPKQTALTKKLKAKHRTKAYIESGLNQSEMARRSGKHRSTINAQVNTEATKNALQEYLDSPKLKEKLVTVAKEGLEANRVISAVNTDRDASGGTTDFIDVPDHNIRHKFWRDLGTALGVLKVVDGQKVQVFVGADLKGFIRGIKNNKVRSDARLD